MTDDNFFTANPFRMLDVSRLPDRSADSASAKCVTRRRRASGAFSRAERLPDANGQDSQNFSRSDDDTDIFLEAMGPVRPLTSRGREVALKQPQDVTVVSFESNMQTVMDDNFEFALSTTDEYLEGHVVGLDQLVMNRLRAGALKPEAHLDLHGLNVVQAFESLRGFIHRCWHNGMRAVLVVPGRGRNSPNGVGVLRDKLQDWLTQEPFNGVVLAFCTARAHDGGPGSIYVLLRKCRKKGRVRWEKRPADADLY
ncbi:MAG: Smr/MutS family protein [Desulfovibrio sp.]|jgi:DNA-nicking Smr family endonuclease|nr:Smr/MutS family protein [Desulfovibrio sp.]